MFFLGRPVGDPSAIRALCWSPDGGKVLTGSADMRDVPTQHWIEAAGIRIDSIDE